MAWLRIVLVCLGMVLAVGRASAEDGAAIVESGKRIQELLKAQKYEDLPPAIEEYMNAVKARFGDKSKEYLAAVQLKAVNLTSLHRYGEAEPVYRQWLALAEGLYGANDKRVLGPIDSFALMLETGIAKYEEAEALMRRSLAIRKAAFGEDSPEMAEVFDRLGTLFANTNRRAEAEPLLVKALAIQEKKGGPEAASAMATLANLLKDTGRRKEAEALFRRALDVLEKAHGPNDPALTTALNGLAFCLHEERKFGEAEALYRRLIAIADAAPAPFRPIGLKGRHNLAVLLFDAHRLNEAEALLKQVVVLDEQTYGPDHPQLAHSLSNLGVLAMGQGRFAEAEKHLRRALAILEKREPEKDVFYVGTLGSVGKLLADMGKLEDAEPILRRAVQLAERLYGPEQRETGVALNHLATLLFYTGRLPDAEKLERRALAIDEKQLGPDHVYTGEVLLNLSGTLREADRADEAEPLARRALAIFEKALPANHPRIAEGLRGLGAILAERKQYAEAETVKRRALSISEAAYGPKHPEVAYDLNNLATLLLEVGRYPEAETMMRRAIPIYEATFGKDHPDVAGAWGNLALLLAAQNDWQGALREMRRATAYTITSIRRAARTSRRAAHYAFEGRKGHFLLHAQMAYRAGRNDPRLREEAFGMAQRATASQAAAALAWSARRFSLRRDRLGGLIREERGLAAQREAVQRWLVEAWSAGNTRASEAARKEMARIDPRLKEIEDQLSREFPDYVAFTNPEPISIARAQALLRPGEVLVQFLSMNKAGPVGNAVYAWAITRKHVKWVELPISMLQMSDHVAALRCGLDMSDWIDPSRWPERNEEDRKAKRAQAKKHKRCLELTDEAPQANRAPRFDLARSHELYEALFGGIERLTRGRQLLIVPSGALTQLPFEVLVTQKPKPAATLEESYRKASWLGVRQAITVLPSASSLAVLRKRGSKSKAARPFAGFGDPLLDGYGENDPRAEAARKRQQCRPSSGVHGGVRAAGLPPVEAPRGTFFDGRIADADALRRQMPLPETADELCTVARSMGPKSDLWLGSRMTEHAIKSLSAKGGLRNYRILHFATHGLVAGDLNGAEPALMFTPPQTPTAEDDGLLTASEVAELDLDADAVVMSACNTAAGDAEDAEALAGLTRAFFYAGARSLLVSHWAVNSDAAVEITTGAFAAMKTNPRIGRAEALRRSLKALIAQGGPAAYPAVWAPFVLVGEGAR